MRLAQSRAGTQVQAGSRKLLQGSSRRPEVHGWQGGWPAPRRGQGHLTRRLILKGQVCWLLLMLPLTLRLLQRMKR